MTTLSQALKNANKPTSVPAQNEPDLLTPADTEQPTGVVELIEVEAVVGGALQKITLRGISPEQVKSFLLGLDPAAKVREEFPSKGNYGNKETKSARALVITARITDSGKYIDITCQNGEDLSVGVSKKKADTFQSDLRALGKISEKNLDKLTAAFEKKTSCVMVLSDEEQFGVNYWKTDDGKAFLDSITAEPPKEAE